jgi:uncharacterized protein YggE
VSWTADSSAELVGQARAAAVADALVHAQQLATAAGAKVGPVVRIHEGGLPAGPGPMGRAMMAMAMPVEAGTQEVVAQVVVVYELVD